MRGDQGSTLNRIISGCVSQDDVFGFYSERQNTIRTDRKGIHKSKIILNRGVVSASGFKGNCSVPGNTTVLHT